VRQGTGGATITPQASSDLITWQHVSQQIGGAILQSDGTAVLSWQDAAPLGTASDGKRFLRVRVEAN